MHSGPFALERGASSAGISGLGDATATVGLLEGQFSVDPANLAAGLQAWKDGDPNDPGLMDRVEAILRGQASSTA